MFKLNDVAVILNNDEIIGVSLKEKERIVCRISKDEYGSGDSLSIEDYTQAFRRILSNLKSGYELIRPRVLVVGYCKSELERIAVRDCLIQAGGI